jgi:hypothetical protein
MQGGIQLGAPSPQAFTRKTSSPVRTARMSCGTRLEESFSLLAKSPPRLVRHWHHATTSRIGISSLFPLFGLRCSITNYSGSVRLIERSAWMSDRDVKQSIWELLHAVGPTSNHASRPEDENSGTKISRRTNAPTSSTMSAYTSAMSLCRRVRRGPLPQMTA